MIAPVSVKWVSTLRSPSAFPNRHQTELALAFGIEPNERFYIISSHYDSHRQNTNLSGIVHFAPISTFKMWTLRNMQCFSRNLSTPAVERAFWFELLRRSWVTRAREVRLGWVRLKSKRKVLRKRNYLCVCITLQFVFEMGFKIIPLWKIYFLKTLLKIH